MASWERFKGGQRVEFLCGGRALGRFRALRDTVAATVRLLSVLPEDLPGSIERLQEEAKERRRSLVTLQIELAGFRAEELAASAQPVRLKPDATELTSGPGIGSLSDEFTPAASGLSRANSGVEVKLVMRALDADANGLKALASAIIAKPGYLVVLVSTSRPTLAVVARSSDVPTSARQTVASLVAAFGGRGGGKPELAQCGGLDAPADAVLETARATVVGDSSHEMPRERGSR